MFYSQFILAKKGPLGTIWIAAHLERKLRKNQVADTDIGVSVDSILFPDVPIALRLSSHLLLGVVRIYSRKVNYLFDDCSETLLKVRQAFRSTAVDLPPEESTAPYHSITLPETFDLDDFELPDNDFFQGNDHHVSSRDQITLQDTMDGVVYSTSQFGLDERFGDAETSGLDLDEELLLNKVAAAEDDGIKLDSDADPQLSVQPMTSPKQDGDHGMTADAEIMQTDANIRDNGREIEFNEYAQAPCTPGLLEEPNLSNVQETSACDDHLESENQNLKKLSVKENLENTSSKSDLYLGNKNEVDEFMFSNVNPDPVPAKENICLPDDLANPQGELPPAETVEQISSVNHDLSVIPSASVSNNVENWKNGIVGNIESGIHSDDKTNNEDSVEYIMENNNQASLEMEVSRNVRLAGDSNTESHSIPELKEQETQENENPKDSVILDPPVKEMNCHFLRPCITHKNQLDTQNPEGDKSVDPEATASCSLETSERENDPFALKSFTEIQGEGYKETEGPEQVLEENHITTLVSCENNNKSNDQADNVISGDGQVENANISVCSDFPAPEKLLSVPEINAQNNFLVEGTPGQVLGQTDAGVDASLTVIGKKRSFAESALTVHSLNSVDSSTLVQTKRTPESVPDDDDLLSSILVGRKSSVLKVKTTPQPEITNLKRHRPAPRTSASKRKVLMDDNMVLHGDMIRQQLTNTEDIRRIRKKAPCTRPEILMIQKQSLEDEIFNETIFTGVSAEFASLHGQTYDLSQIRVSTEDVNNASSGGAMDLRLTSLDDEFGAYLEAEKDAAISVGPNITLETEIGGSNNVAQPVETQLCEVPAISLDPASDIPEAKSSQEEFLGETAGMDVDANTGDVTAGDEQLVFSDKTNEPDASLQINSLGVTDQQLDMFLVEIDANANTEKKDNDIDAVLTDVQTEYLSTTFSPETGGCGTQVLTVDQVIEDNGKNEQVVVNEGSFLYGEEDRAENLVCDGVCQEVNVDASTQAEVNVDLGNLGLDDGQNSYLQEASELNTVDTAISAVDQVDHDGFDYSAAGNDTEFLNYDEEDEEVAEDDDDGGMPNAEETRFIENSGWSSRTRAVAKYLQTMFDKEAERGKKKVLPVDNLLAGKSRKEASRMFFETLVLKTKDYIHVEQTAAFNNINILPRAKLSKSDF